MRLLHNACLVAEQRCSVELDGLRTKLSTLEPGAPEARSCCVVERLAEEDIARLGPSDPANRFNPLLLRLPWPPAGVDRRGSALLLSLANSATAVVSY